MSGITFNGDAYHLFTVLWFNEMSASQESYWRGNQTLPQCRGKLQADSMFAYQAEVKTQPLMSIVLMRHEGYHYISRTIAKISIKCLVKQSNAWSVKYLTYVLYRSDRSCRVYMF